jgi:uncharacterized protein YkwD
MPAALAAVAARLRIAAPAAACLAACACAWAPAALSAPRHEHRSAAHRRAHRLLARRACSHTRLRPTAHDIRVIRAATLCLVNRERLVRGERPLHPSARLRRAAQAHTESMAFDDYFEHVGPRGLGGSTPLARMRAVGYVSSSHVGYEVGENIAWGTLGLATPRAIVAAWMASAPHRANILDPRYRQTGIGVSPHPPASLAHGQAGGIYTQDFGVIIRR